MTKTIIKLYWIWDLDKEEKWLNEMSSKGWQLVGVGYCKYIFEKGLPNEYSYKMELLDNLPLHAKSRQYIQFLEETGAQYIGSIFRWVYFRKKASDGVFDLYSDISSRINHLKRVLVLNIIAGILLLPNAIMQLHAWGNYGSMASLVFGIAGVVVGLWAVYGFFRILAKKQKLQQEKAIRE